MSAIRNLAASINSIANTGYDMANRRIKLGYITSYDPKTYTVRVRLEPESTANELAGDQPGIVESGWLPIWRPYGGNKWGWITPPNANPEPPYGDQCLVLHPDGGQGVVLIGMYNKVEAAHSTYKDVAYSSGSGSTSQSDAPTHKANEIVILHPSGSFIRMNNDKSIKIQAMVGSGMLVSLASNGTLAIVNGSAKSSLRLANGGEIELKTNGGDINIKASAGINVLGGNNSSGTEIITKTHLTLFANQVAAQLAARESGSSSLPTFVITGSANCKCSD